jgi:hypothetical protein
MIALQMYLNQQNYFIYFDIFRQNLFCSLLAFYMQLNTPPSRKQAQRVGNNYLL